MYVKNCILFVGFKNVVNFASNQHCTQVSQFAASPCMKTLTLKFKAVLISITDFEDPGTPTKVPDASFQL